jgi:hypothetical protein
MPIIYTARPKKKIPYGKSLVHGIEEVSHLGIWPDKRALDVRQTYLPHIDGIYEPRKGVVYFFE